MLNLWNEGSTSVPISIRTDKGPASDYLRVFLYDHYPTGDEFVEKTEDFVIGQCGSYSLQTDGTYKSMEYLEGAEKCIEQHTGKECMYCRARAQNTIVSTCMDRLGASCYTVKNTGPMMEFCNWDFQCPASSLSFSLFLIFGLLGALFFLA